MAVRLNLFSNTEQDTKKVSTVEELPQYMLKCIYDNNVAEESEEAKQEKMAKIKRKLEAGKKLTKEELSWLQRNDPIAYAHGNTCSDDCRGSGERTESCKEQRRSKSYCFHRCFRYIGR